MGAPLGAKLCSPVKQCDRCENQIEDVIYDARDPRSGRWGNLCPACFSECGCSLGTGRGQRYDRDSEGDFRKTGG